MPSIDVDSESCQSSIGIWSALRNALAPAVDLLFPPGCADCAAPFVAGRGGRFCDGCRGRLLRDRWSRCMRCCGIIPDFAVECGQCRLQDRSAFSAAACIGAYDRELRAAVLRSKHATEFPLAAALAELLHEMHAATFEAWRIDGVVAMPMHWMRRLVRGVNGPQLIAERLAGFLSAADWSWAMARRRNTPPQASLPPSARAANVRGAFRVRGARRLAGKRILLVDDVMTTGATCQEAAATLRKAGAADVFVAVISRSDA